MAEKTAVISGDVTAAADLIAGMDSDQRAALHALLADRGLSLERARLEVAETYFRSRISGNPAVLSIDKLVSKASGATTLLVQVESQYSLGADELYDAEEAMREAFPGCWLDVWISQSSRPETQRAAV